MPTEQLEPLDVDAFEGVMVGLRGTPVIVNIWASWCGPCRAEMPLLERASRIYEGRIVVLGVDSRDDSSAARRFLDDVDVTYPNVFDAGGGIRRTLGLRGFPTTYFYDRSGRLVETIVGGVTESRLAAQIRALT
jgi:cytochrome c biogenesis protein CcmG/thiol:disulfide interchange protein DsbE